MTEQMNKIPEWLWKELQQVGVSRPPQQTRSQAVKGIITQWMPSYPGQDPPF